MDIFSDASAEKPSDWARSLPRDAFQEIILVLRGALPPPVTGDPGDEARRDRAAMAGVAALRPENAAEGRLAAQFVAADAWAMDCLRLAQEKRREPDIARKCRAQAMGMMREGKSALRMLLRLQAVRQKIEADEEAANRAAWAEHGAAGMMAEALAAASDGPHAPVPQAPAPHAVQQGAGSAAGGAVRPAEATAGSDGRAKKFRIAPENEKNSWKSRSETSVGFLPPDPVALAYGG
jgi:hypothetical protein